MVKVTCNHYQPECGSCGTEQLTINGYGRRIGDVVMAGYFCDNKGVLKPNANSICLFERDMRIFEVVVEGMYQKSLNVDYLNI
ncbi:MAG: hypothetical protein V1870_05815 [Candidatus Aenigmatarchaeota archaeon]